MAAEHVDHLRSDWFDFAWIHVAVSKTSSPNNLSSGAGDWYTYSFDMKDSTLFDETLVGLADRPTINTDGETLHIAIGRDLECIHPFCGCPIPPPVTEHRTVLVALPTSQMLIGSTPAPPPGLKFFSLRLTPGATGESTAMHCIARTYDALPVPGTQYLIAPEMNWARPSFEFRDKMLIGCLKPNGSGGWDYSSQVITLPHGATFYGPAALAPSPQQPGVAQMASQFFSAVFRGDSLWAVHNVIKNTGAPGSPIRDPEGRNVVRWYEFVRSDPDPCLFSLAQWGEIDAEVDLGIAGAFTFDPSISVNSLGDAAVSYTVSSSTTFPTFVMAQRYRTSPTGSMPYHSVIRPGVTDLDAGLRWSDFSGTEVDATGCYFWGHSLEAYDEDEPPGTIPPADHWQSWTAKLDLCIDQDMWADFDGDAALTALDWLEFTYLLGISDRRADVNRDKRHDIADFEQVRHALRNVR